MIPETTKPRLVIITGPTAVGKTDLALVLARDMGGEIISADSMQVYRHMDIGTAKPSAEQQQLVRHHLLDVVSPDEAFNAALFIEAAAPIIQDLHRQKIPVFITGGTGLYIRALLGGLFAGPPADETLRDHYRKLQDLHGQGYLHTELQRVDEAAARRIDPADRVRIIRALEVMTLTGRSIIDSQAEHGFLDKRYEAIKIGLMTDRVTLYDRIDKRTKAMVDTGLIDEVRHLYALGYTDDLKPMQSLGYKHVSAYLKGAIGLDDVIRLTARDTRHYAKRQETWFKAESEMEWFSSNESKRIEYRIHQFLARENPEFA